MRRCDLEHLIRAAGAVSGEGKLVIIGSQSVLGQFPDAPEALLRSAEADVFAEGNPLASDLIDGAIGEGSPFHELFGYYAQGVAAETAVLPDGWRTGCKNPASPSPYARLHKQARPSCSGHAPYDGVLILQTGLGSSNLPFLCDG